jgi:hypothetical protein
MEKIAASRQHTGNRLVDALWSALREVTTALALSPLVGGRLLHAEPGQPDYSGLSFTGGQSRVIAHKLGRKARFFIELYGVDVASANRVNLRPVAFPTNVDSDSHISVMPQNSGSCFVVVL